MKRTAAAVLAGGLILCLLAGCELGGNKSAPGDAVSVQKVSDLAAMGPVGLADRYAGKVVAGQTADVKRDSNKSVQETYVEVGDMVKEGDPLFTYDMEKMQLDLEKLYLDKEGYENTIAAANNSIAELEKERDKAKEGDKLSYTLEIDSRKAEIREAQYNISMKERDIASMEASMEDAVVYSPIAGRVMTVDETGSSYVDPYSYYGGGDNGGDTSVGFITVTDVTRLRVQGNINEMNAYALTEGMPMRIRSRVDSEQTWTGSLSMIDWENPVKNDNNGMVYVSSSGSDEMTQSSKYPFYIELDSTDGLILGQHVYIEPDNGEEEETEPLGPMLPMYFVAYEEDGSAYVWADNGKGKLEKRAVTLGETDEMTGACEITDGLTEDDYIAMPEEGLEEGRAAEKYDPEAAAEEAAMNGEAGGEMMAGAGF